MLRDYIKSIINILSPFLFLSFSVMPFSANRKGAAAMRQMALIAQLLGGSAVKHSSKSGSYWILGPAHVPPRFHLILIRAHSDRSH